MDEKYIKLFKGTQPQPFSGVGDRKETIELKASEALQALESGNLSEDDLRIYELCERFHASPGEDEASILAKAKKKLKEDLVAESKGTRTIPSLWRIQKDERAKHLRLFKKNG